MKDWTAHEIEILKGKYPDNTISELGAMLPGRSLSSIKAKVFKMKLEKSYKKFHFTPEQIEYLKANYHNTRNRDLANFFGCSIHTVENKAFSFGLKKEPDFVAEVARENWFAKEDHPAKKFHYNKGHTPANYKKKQTEYMSPEALEKTKKTRFKKGNKPHNTGRDGEIRWRPQTNYYYIRIKEKNWKEYHRFLWEKHHGPIPEGQNIVFKDGNQRNCVIGNLECITDAELSRRNQIHNKPEELKELYYLRRSLKSAITKSEKNEIN